MTPKEFEQTEILSNQCRAALLYWPPRGGVPLNSARDFVAESILPAWKRPCVTRMRKHRFVIYGSTTRMVLNLATLRRELPPERYRDLLKILRELQVQATTACAAAALVKADLRAYKKRQGVGMKVGTASRNPKRGALERVMKLALAAGQDPRHSFADWAPAYGYKSTRQLYNILADVQKEITTPVS